MKKGDFHDNQDLRPEYKRSDFGHMIRGKFAQSPGAAQETTNDAAPVGQPDPVELALECEQEADGRWLAAVPQLPGVIAYGSSAAAATANAQVLLLRKIADGIEQGELPALNFSIILPTSG